MNATSLADLWVQAAITVDNEEAIDLESESGRSDDEEGAFDVPVASTSAGTATTLLPHHRPSTGSATRPFGLRRFATIDSTNNGRRPSNGSLVPAIFSHTGVRTPPNIGPIPTPGHQSPTGAPTESGLSTITESRTASVMIEKPPSTWSMLPMMVILQYGLLALHTTTHDQVFYLYLVS
jgi:hypothetical protein